MSNKKKPCGMFIHSCYVASLPGGGGGDAVVTKQHMHYPDGTIKPELVVYEKPRRSFWVTKTGLRTHQDKKEFELVQNLDQYDVENYRLEFELAKALLGYTPNNKPRLKKLCNSPYVYGADISIETLIKHNRKENFESSGYRAAPLTTGFFDVETSMAAENFGEITMVTCTVENRVYTAVQKKAFYKKTIGGLIIPGNKEEFLGFARGVLDGVIDELISQDDFVKIGVKNNFEYNLFVGNSEIEIVKWVFAQIHRERVDFMGVWNIDFDVPKVIAAAKRAGVPLEDIFCPPASDLDKKYRYVNYVQDTKQADHPTKKWHWLHATSWTQWYDAMCVYSSLRTVIGKETSYSLDYILKKNGVNGKLTFKDEGKNTKRMSGGDWHRHMQENEPYKYLVYNIFDAVSLQLMEWKNKDVQAMYMLSDSTSLAKYTRQTRKACDTIFFEWKKQGRILASVGETMVGKYDHLMFSTGGAVLRPDRMDGAGLRIFKDAPNIETALTSHNCDVDFTQMYPTVGSAGNISKDTKRSTCIGIYGPAVSRNFDHPGKASEVYFGMLVSPTENAVYIANMFYGLPNYKEMENLFAEHLSADPTIAIPSEMKQAA